MDGVASAFNEVLQLHRSEFLDFCSTQGLSSLFGTWVAVAKMATKHSPLITPAKPLNTSYAKLIPKRNSAKPVLDGTSLRVGWVHVCGIRVLLACREVKTVRFSRHLVVIIGWHEIDLVIFLSRSQKLRTQEHRQT